MKRKILSIIATLFMSLSMVSCNNKAAIDENVVKIVETENVVIIPANDINDFEVRMYGNCFENTNQISKINKIKFGDVIIDLNQYDFYKVYSELDSQYYIYWVDCLKNKSSINGLFKVMFYPHERDFILEYYDKDDKIFYNFYSNASKELCNYFEEKSIVLDTKEYGDVYIRFMFSEFAREKGWIK